MALTILHAGTAAALAAAGSLVSGSQQAQCEALVAPWAGSNVRVRLYAGAVLLRTLTVAPWTINTGTSPRRVVGAAGIADAAVAAGVQTRIVFELLDGTPIFECTAGATSSGADVNFAAGQIRTLCRPTLAVEFLANAALPAVNLPTWLPAPGEVAVLTVANGGLSNNFRDAIAPYFSVPYSIGIVNDYSGAFPNPYYGAYGATQFFGNGHAGGNDNSVIAAVHGYSAITFQRLYDPTPWFGTGTDEPTQIQNSIGNANSRLNLTFMDTLPGIGLVPYQPGAPHSYGCGEVHGPEHGGAACGTFFQIARAAVNHANDAGAASAHRLEIADTTSPSSSRTWVRDSEVVGVMTALNPGAPIWSVHVPEQQRTYLFGYAQNGAKLRWYDHVAKAHVTGTGDSFDWAAGDGPYGAGAFFYVPARQIIVGMWPAGGNLRIEIIDVSVAQPNATKVARTLSAAVPVPNNWNHGCWCEDNSRILVGNVSAGNDRVVEIAIPASLGGTWPVETVPFGAGQSIAFEPPASICNSFKKWKYNRAVPGIVYMRQAVASGGDTVYVYRPRGT